MGTGFGQQPGYVTQQHGKAARVERMHNPPPFTVKKIAFSLRETSSPVNISRTALMQGKYER
jgi:hypothetical protein